jgi:hypothetical protein
MVIHLGDALARYWPLLPPFFAIPLFINRLARRRPRWLLLRQTKNSIATTSASANVRITIG